MNDLQIGKMYLVKKYFWLLYTMKEMASGRARTAEATYQAAKWYSEGYNCNVCVVEENTCFVLLEQDEVCFKLLDSNGNVGWIRCSDFFNYFELVKE